MRDQDAIAQETTWEQAAAALVAQIERVEEEQRPEIERLEAAVEAAQAELDAITDPLYAERIRLWDRIWDSQEARGVELPFMVKMGRSMGRMMRIDTPFLASFPRKVRIGEPTTMEWGTANVIE